MNRLEGLLEEPRPGTPPSITDVQVEEVMTKTLESLQVARESVCVSTGRCMNGLGIQQVAREAVVILDDDMRTRVGNPARLSGFCGVVEDVVHLRDSVVGHLAKLRRHVVADVAGPADVDFAPAGIELAVRRAACLRCFAGWF